MKNIDDSWVKRGYVSSDETDLWRNKTEDELLMALASSEAFERTLAVRRLSELRESKTGHTERLLEMLTTEKALYTRLEICEFLTGGAAETVTLLYQYLGKIGNNQHREIPSSVSKKKSFPLPRDIIARTMGKMNEETASAIFALLANEDEERLAELLDAIGFLVFHHKSLATRENFAHLFNFYKQYWENELLVWKITICCSAFPLKESLELLEEISTTFSHRTIQADIERSRALILREMP